MARIITLKDNVTDENLYPQTVTSAIFEDSGNPLGPVSQNEKLDTGHEISVSGITDSNYSIFTNLNILAGEGFYYKINGSYTRLIICYNGQNANRLVDSDSNTIADATWYYRSSVPSDITSLGLYLEGVTGSITFSIKLSEKTFVNTVVDIYDSINKQTSKTVQKAYSDNLFNNEDILRNTIINDNDGSLSTYMSYFTSNYIAVEADQQYTITGGIRKVLLYDAEKHAIPSTYVNQERIDYSFTPSVNGYMRFTAYNTQIYNVVSKGDPVSEYIEYKERIEENVHLSNTMKTDVLQLVDEDTKKGIELVFTEPLMVFKEGNNQIRATINRAATQGGAYTSNPVFNFIDYNYNSHSLTNDDDIAPLHIFGVTLGAGHGYPCQRLVIAEHGLSNKDVGTYFTLSGTEEKYYIVRIVDDNTLLTIGENISSDPAYPVHRTLSGGSATLEKDSTSYAVTAISSSQLFPFVKNVNHHIYLNGSTEVTEDGNYRAQYIDVVESYGILYSPSVLTYLANHAGTATNPVYDGDVAIIVKNTYRFLPNLSVLVFSTIIPQMQIRFSDAMFSQAVRIGGNGTTQYYLPNSRPQTYDLTKPLAITWDGTAGVFVSANTYWANAQTPVNRVLQFISAHGFAIGFIPDYGIGKNLVNYTDTTFEIRDNTGKVYPHGVNYAVAGNLDAFEVYNAAMFRAFIPASTMTATTLGVYGYELDDAYYLYAEFSGDVKKNILVDSKWNGKSVSVIEAVDCTLLTDVYNDGVYVSASPITGKSCFIVLKIS